MQACGHVRGRGYLALSVYRYQLVRILTSCPCLFTLTDYFILLRFLGIDFFQSKGKERKPDGTFQPVVVPEEQVLAEAAQKLELQFQNKDDLLKAGREVMSAKRKEAWKENKGLSEIDKPSSEPAHNTRDTIAAAAKVSTGAVAMAEVVRKESPELVLLYAQCSPLGGDEELGRFGPIAAVHLSYGLPER